LSMSYARRGKNDLRPTINMVLKQRRPSGRLLYQ